MNELRHFRYTKFTAFAQIVGGLCFFALVLMLGAYAIHLGVRGALNLWQGAPMRAEYALVSPDDRPILTVAGETLRIVGDKGQPLATANLTKSDWPLRLSLYDTNTEEVYQLIFTETQGWTLGRIDKPKSAAAAATSAGK